MQAHALAYNLQDLTSSVLDDLKDSSFSTTRLRRYFNSAVRKVFGTFQFSVSEEEASSTLSISAYRIALPADHDSTIAAVLVDPDYNTTYTVLDEKNYVGHRDFFEKHPDVSVYDDGVPVEWTEFGSYIYVDRPLLKAYQYTIRYHRTPVEMTADADVPDIPETFRDLLEMWALYRAEKYRGNHDVAATYKQDFEDDLEAMQIRYGTRNALGPTIQRQTRRRV